MKKQYLFASLLVLLATMVFAPITRAQTDCDKALIEAENLYQSGQLYDISEKLLQCMENGFNLQQKQSAFRLLTLTYLNINQEEKAKSAFLQLLRLNPDYEVSKEKDPAELYNLFTQFNTRPVFYLGLQGSANLSYPLSMLRRSSSSIAGASDKVYRPGYGFGAGVSFALPLLPGLLLEVSPSYAGTSYNFESDYLTDPFAPTPVVQKVSGSEVYHQLMLPFTLNLRIPQKTGSGGKMYYSLAAGAGPSWTMASSFRNVRRLNQQIFSEEIIEPKVETVDYRRPFNLIVHVEGGLEYKYMGYYWGVRAGMGSSIFNFTHYPNQQEMYLNTMSTNFGWLDDDFVLSGGYLSVFVRKPVYQFLKGGKE